MKSYFWSPKTAKKLTKTPEALRAVTKFRKEMKDMDICYVREGERLLYKIFTKKAF